MSVGARQNPGWSNTTRLLYATIAMVAIISAVEAIDQLSKTMALTRRVGPCKGLAPSGSDLSPIRER